MNYNNETLYHHGIKGQKWGLRRFQNSDGTYTEAGKKRRREDSLGTKLNKSVKSGTEKAKQYYTVFSILERDIL